MAIMEGQGYDSPDPYLSVLQKEKALEERRSLLIEDLITVALLNGLSSVYDICICSLCAIKNML